ncbi:DUF4386 family protein [Ideonella sp. DXS29W]|uniref:DUF4386 family protein n=1 Tax=Ideonella lacteola TaxID=2984193 RepID=A0ABU9BV70_9BURK
MSTAVIVGAGGVSLIAGAFSFMAVFAYLSARFDYPRILDGSASEVLPRLIEGGPPLRRAWAIYSVLPLLLIPGAVGCAAALPASPALAMLATAMACVAALAMCLGLMRWPSMHWALAQAHMGIEDDSDMALEALFRGFNLYLGTYVGEFLGEVCLAAFFALIGAGMLAEPRFPAWIGWAGMAFGGLFVVGALRHVTGRVQPVADVNNGLLPVWMIVLGLSLLLF